jgi:hypothetical protein
MSAEGKFQQVVVALQGAPGVSTAKMFGAPGLRVGTKFFACLVKGELVVKLPRQRVEALLATRQGHAFDPGMGRTMREWLAVAADSPADWTALVVEAHGFVAVQ